MSNQLIQQSDFLSDAFKNQIQMVLPKHLTSDRMSRIALNEFRKNKKLSECDKFSFLGAIMKCCELGLEPSSASGHAYLIPYGKECNLVIGYKGLLKLVRQSGCVTAIYARCVYENDELELQYGLIEKLHHIPAKLNGKDPGKFKAVYAVAYFKDGSSQFEVMFDDEIDKIKKKSPSYRSSSSPWHTDPEEMSKKTVLRRLCKYLPTSTEIQDAISLDEEADRGTQKLTPTIIDMEEEERVLESNDRAQEIINKLKN